MDYKRGQIYRVNLEPTRGSEQQGIARPCLIFSITPLNAKLR
jgi:mRNA-degrading endonuclease toxin of MazEF toxin-antitoxin module